MSSPLLLGLWLAIDPRARHVEWSGGVAMEVRGGSAPLQAGTESEPALRLSVSPNAVMLYEDRVRRRRLQIDYSPQMVSRISEQYFQVSQLRRPLFFHALRASYSADLSPRVSWRSGLGANLGEMDYSLQASQLGSTATGTDDTSGGGSQQAQLSGSPVLTTGGGTASGALTFRLTRLHAVGVATSATVQRMLSQPSGGSTFTLNQTSADLSLSHIGVVSRVDSLTTTGTGGYADFSTNGAQAYAAGNVTWRRRLRPRLDSQLAGGAFFTFQTRSRSGSAAMTCSAEGTPVLPTIDYLLTGRVLQRSRVRVSTNVNTGTRAYFDPVQGSVLPLAGGGVNVDVELPPDVTVGVTSSYYTPPLPVPDCAAANDNAASGRSVLSVTTPVTFQIDRHLSLEAGTIFTGRGPHVSLAGQQGAFPVREFWIYVAFRIAYSS